MKKRVILSCGIFFAIDFLVCALAGNYSCFTLAEIFNFYDKDGYLNFLLLIFNASFVVYIIITLNSLVEEKVQFANYIQIRTGGKRAAIKHISRLIKEMSFVLLPKIILDLIFYFAFDRTEGTQFICNSIALYVTVILWTLLFDCLVNTGIKCNILVVFFISAIFASYFLFNVTDWFVLLIIRPVESTAEFVNAITFKTAVLVLALVADTVIKSKKEYY